ncbi:MAG TPA: hypothetical protein VN892_04685 [Solirubrobacteraceae bacterium]|nr:hypothetical protein [Solirubrobacteraceae bacterium]
MQKRVEATRPRRFQLLVAAAIAAALTALSAGTALAATPTGGFAVFKYCPVSNPTVVDCTVATTESGEFIVGNKTVPIKHTITLQGGLAVNPETGVATFVAATNGETLSKTPQTVPGGLIGIEGLGGEVTATSELAGSAGSIVLNAENLLEGSGTALSLPVKLKLGNPFLGNNCYGGSNAHPITLNLTTGTTSPPKPFKSITGSPGTTTVEEEGEIVVASDTSLVNNTFKAPGVEGCGLVPLLVDPLVDLGFGVPAGEGHNTAILDGTLKLTSAEAVKAHTP